MTQHEMRRIALQALYLANQEPDLDYDEIVSRTQRALDLKDLPDFSQELVKGVLSQKADLDEEISKYLKSGWRIERLAQIDRAILELGLYEIKNSKQIEPVAALDEALNLGEEFSSEKSKAFINGVLGNFIDEK
ncbi:transcription antitermination factor NusB [Lactobacillus rodentium]|uniref:Transcription antitermination protein NusB n=1 Tax=Lactobacillus rodentium TaxID=947835 RepID=A0A2Z6T647_9LACO|nr:transcription antitermination factor NusB [Lactobacillus rodentium]MCR1894097.1 transcription antitermination factor NusB [Lactobacillus rodentium]GBG04394.1 transcription antitermination factor NusB [Lactobacillus rodentium]